MVASLCFLLFFFTTVPKIKSKPCPSLFSYNLQLWKNKQAGNLFLTGATGRVDGVRKTNVYCYIPNGFLPNAHPWTLHVAAVLFAFTVGIISKPIYTKPHCRRLFRAFTEMADSLGSSCDKFKTCTSSQDMKV